MIPRKPIVRRFLRFAFTATVVACILAGTFRAWSADYILICDASISMRNAVEPGRDGRRRLDVVSEALSKFLREIPLESRVYLAAFNRVVTTLDERVVRSDSDRGAMLRAAAGMESLINNENQSGGTHLWAALDHALVKGTDYSNDQIERTILVRVLTDGEDNDPRYRGQSSQSIIDRLRQKYPAMTDRIDTGLVLLGSMEFRLRGIDTQKAGDFRPSFPPAISYLPVNPRAGRPVAFSDSSNQRFDSFDWFIDGTLKSRGKAFTNQFPKSGDYRVKLLVVAPNGQREMNSTVVRVSETEPLAPTFTFVPGKPEPGQKVKFYGRASGQPTSTNWLVDGQQAGVGFELETSFDREGESQITLVVQDASGRVEKFSAKVQVAEKPLAVAFNAPAEAVSGSEVDFQNLTTTPAEWNWDFGDLTSTSAQHPKHRFTNSSEQSAQFTVLLRARSALGHTYESEPRTITIHPSPKPPKAAFEVTQTDPRVGTLVNFNDASTGVITNRQWDFAGEGKSNEERLEFIFVKAGEKMVLLTVTGPGGSDSFTRKVVVHPRETRVRIAMVATNSAIAADFPEEMDFGSVNPVNLRANTFIGIENDTVEVSFSQRPEGSSAVILNISGATNAFQLQLRRDGKLVPLTVPALLTENALIQVALNTKAPEAKHDAELRFEPQGDGVLLNGKSQPVKLKLIANIGSGDVSGGLAILVLVVLAFATWAIWYFYRLGHALGPKSVVTIRLAERRDTAPSSSALSAAASASTNGGNREFRLALNEMIILGQSPDSPHIFNLNAPDWRIRREAKRISLINRKDVKAARDLKNGEVMDIKNSAEQVRRVAVTIEVRRNASPEKTSRTAMKGAKRA